MPRRSRPTCSASPGSARSCGRGRAGIGQRTSGSAPTSRWRPRCGGSWRGAWTDVSAARSSLLALAGKGAVLELLSPAGLALLALLVPLVILYILKVKRRRRAVGSTWLWAVAKRDLMAKSPFKRLIAQVPLILQALALLALGFALARPATRGRAFTGDHVAIVIDTSASMSAAAPGPGDAPTTRLAL